MSYQIGKNYFVRCVTMYYVGRLASVTDTELVLEDAAWVADTGRFGQAMATGTVAEAEPFPDGAVIVSRASVCDAHVWRGELIRVAK